MPRLIREALLKTFSSISMSRTKIQENRTGRNFSHFLPVQTYLVVIHKITY